MIMEPSPNKKILVGVLVAIALVFVGFGFYKSMYPTMPDLTPPPEETVPDRNEYPEEIVNAKHQYKDGKHTYAGAFELPTPCDTLSYDVVRNTSDEKVIGLDFKTIPSENMCAQVVTSRPFKVTFDGPQSISLTVTRDGKSVRFNLFEVPAGQDFDSFQLEIKG